MVRLEGLRKLKQFNEFIEARTNDPSACSQLFVIIAYPVFCYRVGATEQRKKQFYWNQGTIFSNSRWARSWTRRIGKIGCQSVTTQNVH
jgi:hypothetical protein